MSKTYPAIPPPRQDIPALLATITALKQTVEILVGLHGVQGVAAHTFFQDAAPTADRAGDLWITSTGKTRVWNGAQWLAIVP